MINNKARIHIFFKNMKPYEISFIIKFHRLNCVHPFSSTRKPVTKHTIGEKLISKPKASSWKFCSSSLQLDRYPRTLIDSARLSDVSTACLSKPEEINWLAKFVQKFHGSLALYHHQVRFNRLAQAARSTFAKTFEGAAPWFRFVFFLYQYLDIIFYLARELVKRFRGIKKKKEVKHFNPIFVV